MTSKELKKEIAGFIDRYDHESCDTIYRMDEMIDDIESVIAEWYKKNRSRNPVEARRMAAERMRKLSDLNS